MLTMSLALLCKLKYINLLYSQMNLWASNFIPILQVQKTLTSQKVDKFAQVNTAKF